MKRGNTNMEVRPELLSPAGSPEALKAALRFGADAVYIGGPFMQLRAAQTGFDREDVIRAVETAHKAGKKLYVTVNCFALNREIEPLKEYAAFLYSAGVDAAIVSDLGAIMALKAGESRLPIHLSTQANCQNYMTARTYFDLGIERIVLGREMTLEDIAELRAKTPKGLELEVFVHGAMCMAYSGRCLISSYLTGRSGNRGECAQPCRWNYALTEEKRPGEYFPIEETDGYSAILSSHDLCALPFLDRLTATGVCSLKIEGRMKTPYYVAAVTRTYRMALDHALPGEELEEEILSVSHRPYSSGFYFGDEQRSPFNDGLYRQEKKIAANISQVGQNGIWVEQKNLFSVGDRLEILTPGTEIQAFTLTEMRDEERNPVKRAPHPGQRLFIPGSFTCQPGDMLRI